MLVNERASHIVVAIDANLILICNDRGTLLLVSTVRIVTIGTGYRTFVHFVMGWSFEVRFYVLMTGFAKRRLLLLEHGFFTLELVYAVATDATDASLAVCGVFEFRVRSSVAAETDFVLFPGP